jgi:hypothetical protein
MAQGEMKDPSDITEEAAVEIVVDHVLPVSKTATPDAAAK